MSAEPSKVAFPVPKISVVLFDFLPLLTLTVIFLAVVNLSEVADFFALTTLNSAFLPLPAPMLTLSPFVVSAVTVTAKSTSVAFIASVAFGTSVSPIKILVTFS